MPPEGVGRRRPTTQEAPTHERVIASVGRYAPLTSLRVAFERFRRLRARDCVLQFDPDLDPGPDTAPLFERELAGCPDIESLTIVHHGENARMLARRLDGCRGHVEVRAVPSLDAGTGSRCSQPRAARDTWLDEAERPRVRIVHASTTCDLRAAVETSVQLLRNPAMDAVALVLGPEHDLSPDLIDTLARGLSACEELHTLVLVHPSPLVGLAVSMLRPRLPRVFITSCRAEADIVRAAARH